ncbi:MAG TPA: hypothetical protein VJR29_08375 [bacterium]|nr:hypothetical protein [bacterium]
MDWYISKLACSVCFSAGARSLEAYYWTTALLMLLPLGIAGAAIYWIRSRNKRP